MKFISQERMKSQKLSFQEQEVEEEKALKKILIYLMLTITFITIITIITITISLDFHFIRKSMYWLEMHIISSKLNTEKMELMEIVKFIIIMYQMKQIKAGY